MKTQSIYKTQSGKKEIMALYDAVLDRWPAAHETMNLSTRHGRTFVIASGKKSHPPLLLIHGSSSNATAWVADIAELSKSFRVYVPDLPGEPGKSAENRPNWQDLSFAEWMEDVLDGVKIKKTALAGISQGGWTALRFASVKPERVSKLVLLAPGGIVPVRGSFILHAIFLSMLGHWGAVKLNRIVFGKQPIHPAAARYMEAIYTHFNPRVEKEYLFSDEELGRLSMPTLLIGGEDDALIDMHNVCERMRLHVPDLKSILIPDMGHALVNQSGRIVPFLIN